MDDQHPFSLLRSADNLHPQISGTLFVIPAQCIIYPSNPLDAGLIFMSLFVECVGCPGGVESKGLNLMGKKMAI